ncbi:MAG: LuxR C-terminal-related transcriptional regulator [Motiliproteus sp.]
MIRALITGPHPLYRMAIANVLKNLGELHWRESSDPFSSAAAVSEPTDVLIICATTNDSELIQQLEQTPRLSQAKVVLFTQRLGKRHRKLLADDRIDLCLPLSIPQSLAKDYLEQLLRSSSLGLAYRVLDDPTIRHCYHPDLSDLTCSERKVLLNLQLGLSNRLIAERMCIRLNTVKVHLAKACRKAGFRNRYQAASYTCQQLAFGQTTL